MIVNEFSENLFETLILLFPGFKAVKVTDELGLPISSKTFSPGTGLISSMVQFVYNSISEVSMFTPETDRLACSSTLSITTALRFVVRYPAFSSKISELSPSFKTVTSKTTLSEPSIEAVIEQFPSLIPVTFAEQIFSLEESPLTIAIEEFEVVHDILSVFDKPKLSTFIDFVSFAAIRR